jgi:GTP pyrophosphokinase
LFPVELHISGIDSGVGVIQKLTNEISTKLGLNIRSFSIEGNEGYFEGRVGIFVANKDQLNHALKAIKELDGVSAVERIDKSFKK